MWCCLVDVRILPQLFYKNKHGVTKIFKFVMFFCDACKCRAYCSVCSATLADPGCTMKIELKSHLIYIASHQLILMILKCRLPQNVLSRFFDLLSIDTVCQTPILAELIQNKQNVVKLLNAYCCVLATVNRCNFREYLE